MLMESCVVGLLVVHSGCSVVQLLNRLIKQTSTLEVSSCHSPDLASERRWTPVIISVYCSAKPRSIRYTSFAIRPLPMQTFSGHRSRCMMPARSERRVSPSVFGKVWAIVFMWRVVCAWEVRDTCSRADVSSARMLVHALSKKSRG